MKELTIIWLFYKGHSILFKQLAGSIDIRDSNSNMAYFKINIFFFTFLG